VKSGEIESIVARSLLDPGFLEGLRHQPSQVLAGYVLPPEARRELEASDWDKVRDFAGFIGKVQHNYLWELFPFTRWLLTCYGIDHAVFADYRATQLSSTARLRDRATRALAFLDFLSVWLKRVRLAPRRGSILLDVIEHERATCEVRRAAGPPPHPTTEADVSDLAWPTFQRVVLEPAGHVQVHRFRNNPLGIVESIAAGQFEGTARAERRVVLTYWFDGVAQQVRVASIDEIAALLLRCIDGRRSVRAVIAAARRTLDMRPVQMRPLLETVVGLGIVRLRVEAGRARRLR
jgi:hypothetical protein